MRVHPAKCVSPAHLRGRPRAVAPWAGALACLALIPLAGCQTTRVVSLQTFCRAPEGWTDLAGQPASLRVKGCGLDLEGDEALRDPTPWSSFRVVVDAAFTGGNSRGFAGILVEDVAASDRRFHCLALRPGGQWRVFRSSSPLDPLGGRGWQSLGKESVAGFHRLEASVDATEIRFLLDGRPVGQYAVESSGGGGDGGDDGRWRAGLFSRDVATRWKNFLAGASTRENPFEPAGLADWGDVTQGEDRLKAAVAQAKAFRTHPDRMRLLALVASLDEARHIHAATGDARKMRVADEFVRKISGFVSASASGTGLEGAVSRAFARLARAESAGGGAGEGSRFLKEAAEAESAGKPAAAACLYAAAVAGGADAAARRKLQASLARLPPLRLDFVFSSRARRPILDEKLFWDAVRERYGTLSLARGGELEISVTLLRASNETDSRKGKRRVAVFVHGGARLRSLVEERDGLRARLPGELADSLARANILRSGVHIGGSSSAGMLKTLDLGGKTYELLIDDAERLAADYRHLDELERSIQQAGRRESVKYHTIPATSRTSSLSVVFSLSVKVDGKERIHMPSEEVYLGIEEWEHPAYPKLGIAASKFRPEATRQAVMAVRDRARKRFEAGISLEKILAGMDRSEQTAFALRYARSARTREARSLLEWLLQRDFELARSLRSRTAALCVDS